MGRGVPLAGIGARGHVVKTPDGSLWSRLADASGAFFCDSPVPGYLMTSDGSHSDSAGMKVTSISTANITP